MTTRSCFKQSKEPLRACNHAFNSSYFLLSIPSASRRLLIVSIKLTGTRKLFLFFAANYQFNITIGVVKLSKFVLDCMAKYTRGSSFWRVGRGGGITHPRLQHLVKWLWERVWDFSALGGPTSSVSRRVVKLTVSHYYSVPLPLQKRGYGDEIRNPVVFMIPNTVSGSGVGGRGMHNGCDFWN